MSLQNPLENYNRHNPFVMQAKYHYHDLMREYEALSQEFVTVTIGTIADAICCLILGIAGCLTTGAAALIPLIMILFFIGLWEWRAYKILKDRIQDPENGKMDKMASLEMSEVQEINEEYVYELINIIHTLIGRAYQARKTLMPMAMIALGGTIVYDVSMLVLIFCK